MSTLRSLIRVSLPACLWLLLLPAAVQAQFIFATNNGAITITSYSGNPTNLDIPDFTNGYAVVNVGDSAFKSRSTLTMVTIPASVTNIGNYSFQFCASLTNVLLGNGVISIGDEAFGYDDQLASVTIPNNVTSIGAMAFSDCGSVTTISLGSGVTNIGAEAFISDESLDTITVDTANPAYSSMAGVLFDKSQTTLLQYPGGKPGNYVIPNGVTNVADSAFDLCSGLTSIATGDGVASIGLYAFADDNLTNITLGAGVTRIGSEAFGGDFHLLAITVATNNPAYSDQEGVLFDKNQTTLLQYPGGKPGNYTTPGTVTSIGDYAFSSCGNLTNVTISDNVTSLGYGVFFDSINLTNITIGAGVTGIGGDAFDECYSLATISVATNNPAFSSAAGMLFGQNQTTLICCPAGIAGNCTIPGTVTNIGDYAFLNDYRLNSVYFEGNAPHMGSLGFSDPLTVFYMPGATGWGPLLGGMTTVLWNPQAQDCGVRSNQFGFYITGNTNFVIVVEACTNLAHPGWQPVQTNTLPTGSVYFSDSQWTNCPARYYRFRSP